MGGVSRLLCLIGSGETSASMVSLHAEMMERAGSPPAPAVMLDTSYGFQENADEISARAQTYFQVNVGRPLDIASYRDRESADPIALERVANQLRDARFVFAGPGSPSYVLRQWRGTPLPGLIGDRLASGGCVTFASAAALSLGRLVLPVYEIYKVGLPPHWLDGLNLLAPLGLDVVVIPHYDNSEGGTHDTRYCYMGERRLLQLERLLPEGVAILGVAEHTAAIFDLDARALEVRGRGFVAVRRAGVERRIESGRRIELDRLGLMPLQSKPGSRPARQAAPGHNGDAPSSNGRRSLLELVDDRRREFEGALAGGDLAAALRIVLDLDDRLTGDGAGLDQGLRRRARSIYRGMLVRLGESGSGQGDQGRLVAPFVELALRLRDDARRERRFSEADLVRAALSELRVEVRDTPSGPEWSIPDRG